MGEQKEWKFYIFDCIWR